MPNTLYVDAGYMPRMRRCWAHVRLVTVRVPRVIRTVRKGSAGSAARFPDWTDRLDVSDGAFAYFDGPVQAVDANEAVAGSHKPLHLDIRALADTEPDEWLRELGRRKIDSLVVEDDDVFEMLSSI